MPKKDYYNWLKATLPVDFRVGTCLYPRMETKEIDFYCILPFGWLLSMIWLVKT